MKFDTIRASGNPSFFIPGGTLPGDAPSYVTRQADYDLLEGLRGGQFCYVLTSRQMGKSSLMVRIANQLREEDVAVAVLDLTSLGQNLTVEQWYFGLMEQLGRHLKLEDELDDYWQSHKSLGPLQRWMAAIRDVVLPHRTHQITLFVDEIDIVRSLPFSTDEFFAAIRECYNRRAQEPEYKRLTFCLLGVATPSDLITDTRTTPFNIGRRIELADFALQEAETLSVGISVMGRDGHGLLSRILYWTGGHPYLTQRLCMSVVEDTAALREEDVDRLCADLFLTHKARESDDNLQFVRNRLLRSEVDLTALLELYSKVRRNAHVIDDETSVLTSVLKLSGVTRVTQGELQVRNRIYDNVFDHDWVRAHMPDAELRRQRAAYRQGLMRAMALSSAVLVALAGLAIFGFMQARRANHNEDIAHKATLKAQTQADNAEHISYIARMNLIQRDWEINDVSNIIDLLADTQKSKFQGFEWGYWNRLSHRDMLTLGHPSYVTSVAYSPDGKHIVTGSRDNIARIWDAETGRETIALKGHSRAITSLAYSPNGKRIVTGSDDSTAKVWDAISGQEAFSINGVKGTVTSVAFSPDEKCIVTGCDDKTARVWDAATGKETLILKGHSRAVTSLAYSPNGKRIVTGSDDNTAKVWDAATGREMLTLKGHTNNINSVSYSPDGKHIVTGSEDRTAKIWDAISGHEMLMLKGHTDSIKSAAYSSDGKCIVTGSTDNTARIWESATGHNTLTLKGYTFGGVRSVAFSPDSKRIVTGCDDKTARIWDAVSQETLTFHVIIPPQPFVESVAFSPDGTHIVIGAWDPTIKVWDTETGQETLTLKGHKDRIGSVAYSPDGNRIATGSADKTARVWDAKTGQEILILKGHTDLIDSIAFSPDGKRIVTGSNDNTARVWDLTTGQEILTLTGKTHKGYRDEVNSVAFSPDGKRIATGNNDKTVRIWDLATGHEMLTIEGHLGAVLSLAYSPNGKRIVTASDDSTAKVWDAATGQEILTLKGHTSEVHSVAYSPDGRRIITGSYDKTAKIWDAITGQETLTLTAHSANVQSVAFSPDGKRIVTGSYDGTAKIWYSDAADFPKSMREGEAH